MEDRLQNQMGHGEGQLKVKEEDLTRVEKQLEAHTSGERGEPEYGISEPERRCVENQTCQSGEELPERAVCREEALHREAGHQRGGLQKAALLQKRSEAPNMKKQEKCEKE